MSDTENNIDIDGIAADWAVRASERELSQEERHELDAWLARDSRRQGAYVRALAIWRDLDRVAAMAHGRSAETVRESRPRRWRTFGVAASLLLAVSLGAGIVHDHFSGRHVAGIGEIVRIALDDGSTVMLNTDSVIRVRYAKASRRIELHRGEATFQVTRDSEHPFVVEAGDVVARAVGTQFAVRRTGDAVSVTVIEGVVEVKRPDSTHLQERRRISSNDRVIVAPSRPMVEDGLSTEEVSRRLSWREGYLTFDGERLENAAAEMNRYSSIAIRIENPDLASEQFVGVFRVGDVRAFARSAAVAFNARMHEDTNSIVLTREPPPPKRP